jgi:hypothetical protein
MHKESQDRQKLETSIIVNADSLVHLLIAKNRSYGNAFSEAGKVLAILYPNGIPLEKYNDALVTVRILDKLFRISNSPEAFNEDPWKDIAGYSLLMSSYQMPQE